MSRMVLKKAKAQALQLTLAWPAGRYCEGNEGRAASSRGIKPERSLMLFLLYPTSITSE